MSIKMLGLDVAKAMKEEMIRETEELKKKGIEPRLVLVRVGTRPDDLAYERGARKRLAAIGITCEVLELSEDISQEKLQTEFGKVNDDPEVHGIMLFRPLPEKLDEEPLKDMIHPYKDVDCMSPVNIAKVFSGDDSGYAPCTAEAVMEMLGYYGIGLEGKKAAIIGRSMVVGRPLAMLMLKCHATITVCHTRTKELVRTCSGADILVAAAGKAGMVKADMVKEGAVVVDVGINVDDEGNLCGDVAFEEVEGRASYISPVPKGVGSVTSSVLARHVIKGAYHSLL